MQGQHAEAVRRLKKRLGIRRRRQGIGGGYRLRTMTEERVDHDVADKMDLALVDPLAH